MLMASITLSGSPHMFANGWMFANWWTLASGPVFPWFKFWTKQRIAMVLISLSMSVRPQHKFYLESPFNDGSAVALDSILTC
jgi:hypothetical protein